MNLALIERRVAELLEASVVQCFRDDRRLAFVLRVEVPDMVPALQRQSASVDGLMARTDGPRVFGHVIGKMLHVVESERELRRWWSCDP